MVAASRSRFAVKLLGGFELRYEGRAVRTTPAAQRLVAFVATRTSTSRTAVAWALWPSATSGSRSPKASIAGNVGAASSSRRNTGRLDPAPTHDPAGA
jgi:hypothetical protein